MGLVSLSPLSPLLSVFAILPNLVYAPKIANIVAWEPGFPNCTSANVPIGGASVSLFQPGLALRAEVRWMNRAPVACSIDSAGFPFASIAIRTLARTLDALAFWSVVVIWY